MRDTEHVTDLGEWVQADPHASKPLFDQLRGQMIDQVLGGIAAGTLTAGDQLPTVRQVAVDLSINPNTVARAYRELESAGILETRGRFGTFVARTDPADAAMATAAHTYATAAKSLGVAKDDALKYIEAAFG